MHHKHDFQSGFIIHLMNNFAYKKSEQYSKTLVSLKLLFPSSKIKKNFGFKLKLWTTQNLISVLIIPMNLDFSRKDAPSVWFEGRSEAFCEKSNTGNDPQVL